MDLIAFADQVAGDDPVTIEGTGTRGGGVPDARRVGAPSGIVRLEPDEMVLECGAGTPVVEIEAALAEVGQTVALPSGGTVGGALAVGRSGIHRLGYGPMRDVLLQARYADSSGRLVQAGGPTVKNVSGFDLCRLLVGSKGTLGFIGSVILRTRPRPPYSGWYAGAVEPKRALVELYRPTSLLWDGTTVWALLEGVEADIVKQAAAIGLTPASPPKLPTDWRWSLPPRQLLDNPRSLGAGPFIAELGVGIVHHTEPPPVVKIDATVEELHRRIKARFDPAGRLNPGVDPLVATHA